MSAAVIKTSSADELYAQLEALPENLTGEIINGRFYAQPRPTTPHTLAGSGLEIDIGGA
jgi:hypothetical protein